MHNPFKFGEVVTGDYFANRKKEIKDIIQYIRAGQNLFIYSYRRLGKTSLIKIVLESLFKKKEIIAIYVDIQKVTSQAQFIEVYSSSISKALITKKEKLEKILNFFKRIVPSFEVDQSGNWRVSFDFSKTTANVERSLEEVLEIPLKIASSYNKRVVIVFDEFQEIEGINGKSFEKKLRSHIQHHNDVCYIFMGSKTHIIMDMFNNPERAFYKSSAIYPITTINQKEMVEFVKKRFKYTNKFITDELAQEIVKLSNNIPYNIQLLSFNVWLLLEQKVKKENILTAIDVIMHTQNELFFSLYDSLSLHQRSVIYALSNTDNIFSTDSILKYNLASSSSVQASLRALIRNNFVHKQEKKYYIADPFFKIWIQRNISI